MIVLERTIPENLAFLEVILKRSINQSNENFYIQYQSLRAGYWGECRVDREWQDFEIKHQHYVFHNYEASNEWGFTHQIDTLFVCTHFILIIEVKNITGRLDFDHEKHQFIRTKIDGLQESFHNPIDQTERHLSFLKACLKKWHMDIPVIPAIVNANSSAIIGTVPPNFLIFNVSGLRSKIQLLFDKYPNQFITNIQLNLLKDRLLMNYSKRIVEKVYPENLVLGVICPDCKPPIKMSHRRRGFICPECLYSSGLDILIQGLRDYRILYGEWITNTAFRDFFGVESIQTANNMLNRLNLPSEGEKRGRKYRIPSQIFWKDK